MADDTIRLDDGAGDALSGIHRRATTALDGATGGRPGGDLGDGADEIDAIMTRLAGLGEEVAKGHSTLAYRVQTYVHGIVSTDAGVQAAIEDLADR